VTKHWVLVVAALLWIPGGSALLAADEPVIPPQIREEIVSVVRKGVEAARKDKGRVKEVADLRLRLKAIQGAKVDPTANQGEGKLVFTTEAAKREAIRVATDRIEAWESPATHAGEYAPELESFKGGFYGRLPWDVRIIKVLDKTSALVEFRTLNPRAGTRTSVVLVVYDVETAEMVEGRDVTLPQCFYSAGPRKVGDNTITALIAFNPTSGEAAVINGKK
jgi:hypothetical protein